MVKCCRMAVVLGGLLSSLWMTGCSSRSSTAKRVLILTIDTLRWDRLGYTGYDIETPNLDALSETGTTFTQAITVTPLTLPSHASLFTSHYPSRHGVRSNGTFQLQSNAVTLAEVFREAGFATGAFIGAFVLDRRFGLAQGFDHYDDELPDEVRHKIYYAERPAKEVVSRAIDWIHAQEDESFFAWVHVFEPHAPYEPPLPFSEQYADRMYDGEVAHTDQMIKPILDLVSSMEDSIVVVTSDHGESLGEHGETSHGLYIYDSTTRIPLVMNGSGVPKGLRIDAPVRIVDIAPTVLDFAGYQFPGNTDGESLVPFLQEEPFPELDAYSESFLPRYSFNWSEIRSLRRSGLKFIQAPKPELFDLELDPREGVNLMETSRASEAVPLAAVLDQMIESQDPSGAKPLQLDQSARRRLESLGYLSPDVVRNEGPVTKRVDPKDRIEVYEHMQELLSPELTAEQAIEGYRAILELEPTNTLSRNRLANTLAEEGRLQEAIEEYRQLVLDTEIDFRGLENLSAALLLQGETDEALATTETAIATAPWNPDFHVLRGEALEQARRFDESKDAYLSALEVEASAENYWRVGTVYEKLGVASDAEKQYRDALIKDETFRPAASALARLLSRTGRAGEGLEILEDFVPDGSIQTQPSIKLVYPNEIHLPVEIATALAEVNMALGNVIEARIILEKSRLQYPQNTRVLVLLGLLHGRAGELDEAATVLEKSLELGETTPDLLKNLAIVYLRQNRPNMAVTYLEKVCKLVPDDPSSWYSLGNAYYQMGSGVRAVEAYSRALELRSPWPEAMFNLGIVASEVGRREIAIKAFRDYLAVASDTDTTRREAAEKQLSRLTQQN